MEKTKPKLFTIEIPLYNIDLIFSFLNPSEKVKSYLNKHWDFKDLDTIVSDPGGARAVTSYLDYGGPILLRVVKADDLTGTIAHEVFHVVAWIMRSRGVEYSASSEEAFAYLTGYITREIYIKLV